MKYTKILKSLHLRSTLPCINIDELIDLILTTTNMELVEYLGYSDSTSMNRFLSRCFPGKPPKLTYRMYLEHLGITYIEEVGKDVEVDKPNICTPSGPEPELTNTSATRTANTKCIGELCEWVYSIGPTEVILSQLSETEVSFYKGWERRKHEYERHCKTIAIKHTELEKRAYAFYKKASREGYTPPIDYTMVETMSDISERDALISCWAPTYQEEFADRQRIIALESKGGKFY